MSTLITKGDPTAEIVKAITPDNSGTGTGTYFAVHAVSLPLNLTSTSNAATNWINPETGTVAAKVFLVITTAGTGTIDIGRSTDGTGSDDTIINGGTLLAGVVTRPGTNAVTGVLNETYILLGPGGTGTNNSIVAAHTDTPTSTMAGKLVIQYFLVGS